LNMRVREVPDLRERLRVIEAWGPYPIQPIVVRSALPAELKEEMRASLLALERNPRTRRTLSEFGLERFVPVTDADYSRELLARRKPG
jgi:phosphonate transport system substrate-binding protein